MCGIAGFFSAEGVFDEADLSVMAEKINHRGPDASGVFFDSGVGLAHKRLSVIDLSAEANQPMISHSGNTVIVYNGEVYNFEEIKKELELDTKTTSDTEVILEAFERWGVSFVNRLNGMFAIAVYDKREKKLYLFRDRIGIKPLFYYLHKGGLAFASELKSLPVVKEIKTNIELNREAIGEFLHLGYIPAPNTIYTNIFKLPQGCYAVFDGNELVVDKYWSAPDLVSDSVISDFSKAKRELKELIISSVKYRLIADVPYGTFLSGGIDSSLVTAVAQSEIKAKLKTFSIGFKDSVFNESVYARRVASHLKTDHHEFVLTEKDAVNLIPDIIDYYDEPFADSSAIPTMLVSEIAKKHVTVTLSGDGGDELFMGYGMYNWAERLNNPFIKSVKPLLKIVLSQMGNRYKRASHLFNSVNQASLKSHIFSQEQYLFSQKEINRLLPKGYRSIMELGSGQEFNRSLTPSEEQALFDLMYYLPDDLLTKVDRASMKYSLETRVPLLDHRIVEFALRLSPELKKKGNVAKYLLKEVLYDYVPKEMFDRPKRGFGVPLAKWLKTDLKYLIEEYLNEQKVREAGLVEYSVVREYVLRFLNGTEEYLYNRVWLLIVLHMWFYKERI